MELLALLIVLALLVPLAVFAAPVIVLIGPMIVAGCLISYLYDRHHATGTPAA